MSIDIDTIVYMAGFIITISGALTIIIKLSKKAISDVTQEVVKDYMKKHSDNINALTDRVNELIEHSDNNNDEIKEALLAIIRNQMNQIIIQYKRRKSIGTHTLFVVEELYRLYKKLGGNSFIDDQMKIIRSLQVVNAEDNIG